MGCCGSVCWGNRNPVRRLASEKTTTKTMVIAQGSGEPRTSAPEMCVHCLGLGGFWIISSDKGYFEECEACNGMAKKPMT